MPAFHLLDAGSLILAAMVMAVGAAIQGAIGFGANLFAAPLLVLISHDYVPAPVIMAAFVLNLLIMRRDPGPHHWRLAAWPIAGQIPGALAGAALLSVVTARDGLGVLFGALTLVAVGLSLSGLHPRPSRPVLAGSGTLSGFMQTTAGMGGPPIALALQHAEGPELRGALARFFGVSCVVSIAMLAIFGQVTGHDAVIGAALLPGTVVGFAVSGRLARHVDRGRVRIGVLSLSAVAATIILVKSVL